MKKTTVVRGKWPRVCIKAVAFKQSFLFFVFSLAISLPGQSSASCADIFRPLADKHFDGASSSKEKDDLVQFELHLKTKNLWKKRESFHKLIRNLDATERLIVRGVAPREAVTAVQSKSPSGRLRMRAVYGIKDEAIRPGFLIDGNISPKDLTNIVYDLDRYASQGAALERFAIKYNGGEPLTALEIKFNRLYKGWNIEDVPMAAGHFGYWIVYSVPFGVDLTFHPESKVRVREKVVNIPEESDIIAVIPGSTP